MRFAKQMAHTATGCNAGYFMRNETRKTEIDSKTPLHYCIHHRMML